MSTAAQEDELLEEIGQKMKDLARSFDILAKRQTMLFQQVQELRETTEKWFQEHDSKHPV
jgi:hypothetical protein